MLALAGGILRQGGLVAMPTETVYGLAGDATQGKAVAAIFEAKGRPTFNPLIVHAASLAQAQNYGIFNAAARSLAEIFWPGPMTLVVPAIPENPISSLVTAGLDSIALRVPNHEGARALIEAADRPLAAPSANRSGRVSPTTAVAVEEELGARVDLILDGGPCDVGLESSVIAVNDAGVSVLRPGAITRTMVEAVCGPFLNSIPHPDRPRSPGQLLNHYAPETRVRLNAESVEADEALLAFGPEPLEGAKIGLNLSHNSDLREAASNLFAYLRRLDGTGAKSIAVMPIPTGGLGEAINDRLSRAAAKKTKADADTPYPHPS
jgi:L-threonylcarbamoyladenylate synthase